MRHSKAVYECPWCSERITSTKKIKTQEDAQMIPRMIKEHNYAKHNK